MIAPLSGPALSYAYDAAGKMTSGGGRTLSYTASGMVATVAEGSSTVSYAHDPGNQRTVQTTPTETTRYYGFSPDVQSELQAYPSGQTRWIDYVNAPTGPTGAVYTTTPAGGGTATDTALYYAQDHLGSIAATMVSDGSGQSERSYDSWGKQRFTTGQDDTGNTLYAANAETRGYIGQEQVAAISLVNLNRRMYDPWIGRFLQADPIVDSVANAQALNPYSYGQNNPLTLSDPSGVDALGNFFDHAFGGVNTFLDHALAGQAALNILREVIGISIAAFGGEFLLPEMEGFASLSAVADASLGEAAADVALSGAIGGAINTGTLRGTLIGAATAEAFFGVGTVGSSAPNIPAGAPMSSWSAGQIAGMVALHAAVGCASSAAGGGRCGSGAVAGGLGELTSGIAPSVSDNAFVQSAVAGLGGGAGSALAGGKFGDGFFIAASGYLFNQLAHNGTDPNSRHQLGVNAAMSDLESQGFEILDGGATMPVGVLGFGTPRVYDFGMLDPSSGIVSGVEVKTSLWGTLFFNSDQVAKDLSVVANGGVVLSDPNTIVRGVAYMTYCFGCSAIDTRSASLWFRMQSAGIPIQTQSLPRLSGQ